MNRSCVSAICCFFAVGSIDTIAFAQSQLTDITHISRVRSVPDGDFILDLRQDLNNLNLEYEYDLTNPASCTSLSDGVRLAFSDVNSTVLQNAVSSSNSFSADVRFLISGTDCDGAGRPVAIVMHHQWTEFGNMVENGN